jgi:uncharacterized protein (TIGR03437 family)
VSIPACTQVAKPIRNKPSGLYVFTKVIKTLKILIPTLAFASASLVGIADDTTARRAPKHPAPRPARAATENPAGSLTKTPAGKHGRLERFALILSDAPVARSVSSRSQLAGVAAVQKRQSILAGQQRLKTALAARKIHVVGATQVLLNAVYVIAPQEDEAVLRAQPGVIALARMRPIHRNLNQALGLIGLPQGWSAVGGKGNAGAGMRIGIVDTGLDDFHPAFQDNSLIPPSNYPPSDAHEPNWPGYTNNKIIVARSYVYELVDFGNAGDSRPDDLSPYDRFGHGTAAAMIAAGETVNAPRATITGVAPKAFLGNYKVFGSPGVNDITFPDVVLNALEDALTDGMDVVNLALGMPALWGPNDSGSTCGAAAGTPCDYFAGAVESAAGLGLTIVAAAGNSGNSGQVSNPSYGTIESPGTVDSVITVGASYNAHIFYASVGTANNQYNAFFADSPKPGSPLTAPLVDVSSIDGTNPDACFPLPSNALSGSIALIQRDAACHFDLQAINAENAGAVGIVFSQFSGSDFIFNIQGLTGIGIPVAMVGSTDGTTLQGLASQANRKLTLNPSIAESPATADFVAYFSSRGPATGTSAVKPELVAPGTDIYTATQSYDPNGGLYDPSGYTVVEGTSFSAAFVAGTVALVKQLNPNFTPAQVKSAVVNTASETVNDFDSTGSQVLAGIEAVGAGKLNVPNALATTVTIEPSTLSFGLINGFLPSATLKLTNFGGNTVTLNLSVDPFFTDPNAHLSLSNASITLAPNASRTVTVSLQGSLPTAGIYEGDLNITGGPVALHVPYLYLVGDGNEVNAFPLRGDGFADAAGYGLNGDLLVKAVDQFGAPVTGLPILFSSTYGGGTINSGSSTAGTDNLGIGFAQATLGDQLGLQEFAVALDNPAAFNVYFDGRAFPLPTIGSGGVVNGASFVVNSPGFAPGSYISLFGTGLGEVTRRFFTPYLPLSLGNISVSFDIPSQNISYPGAIVFISDGQLNVQIPWELAGQTSAVVKVSNGLTSGVTTTIPISPYGPGFFEYLDQSGNTYLAAQDANFRLIGPSNPAQLGGTILLYANGLGPVSSPPPSGEPTPAGPQSTITLPIVTIGGQNASVAYSGLSPQSIGLYQVNVVVPQNLAAGPQKVTLSINGVPAKTSTIVVN